MTNTNCLEGWQCPGCGWTESFLVSLRIAAVVEMTDNGYDFDDADIGHSDFDGDDWARCTGCDHEGTVKDFQGGST